MLTSMLSTLAVAATLCATGFAATALPIVDVGYAVHQATLNVIYSLRPFLLLGPHKNKQSSGINSYYNFSNIRYGQAPIGNLRFSAPLAPTGRNATVNDGQQGAVCAQADPGIFFSFSLNSSPLPQSLDTIRVLDILIMN